MIYGSSDLRHYRSEMLLWQTSFPVNHVEGIQMTQQVVSTSTGYVPTSTGRSFAVLEVVI